MIIHACPADFAKTDSWELWMLWSVLTKNIPRNSPNWTGAAIESYRHSGSCTSGISCSAWRIKLLKSFVATFSCSMSTVSIKCRSCIILHSLPSSTLISLQILQLCVQWYSPCFSVPENGALCLPGLLPDDSQLLSCSSCSQAICLPRRVARNWRDRPGLWPDLRKPRHHVARA